MTDYIDGFEIGTTLDGMENIESLSETMRGPKWKFSDFATYVTLANGEEKGRGLPTTEWNFGMLSQDDRDELKEFCAGSSATVYIKTPNNDGEYGIYQAVMLWPQNYDENVDSVATRLDFIIRFKNMILQEEEP